MGRRRTKLPPDKRRTVFELASLDDICVACCAGLEQLAERCVACRCPPVRQVDAKQASPPSVLAGTVQEVPVQRIVSNGKT